MAPNSKESDLHVKQALATALEAKGYATLTPVQQAVTDPDLAGQDMLVSAQTGSGKTLGFGLAIAPGLFGEAERFEPAGAPLALVIAPTRELALQVKRELSWLFEKAGAVLASTVGGMDMRDERRALERGAHIVVSTPGRLRDHIMRGSIDLGALRAVVLDEADEMLDLGFREDLEFILEEAPSERQTLLFSATVPAAIAKLAENYQRDAVRIATASGATQHADIDYRALNVAPRDSENAIINVLRYYESPNAIVFCNTRAMVNRLTTRLSNRGFSVVALSGELSQTERTHALQAMRDGRARVCVATDVAARGIDLPNLELVIHAELPSNQDTLLHRSGRTGRAGRKGVSVMIVPPAVRKKAQRLLGWAKLQAEWGNAPSADEVMAKDDERMLADADWSAEVEEANLSAVSQLAQSFSAEQLAAAYVRLYRERRSAPEELSDPGAAAKPRAPFGPSVWFSLTGGATAGAEPRRLLPMLCKMGDLSREDIGAIRVQQDMSLIELRQAAVEGFLKAVGPAMVMEGGAALSQMDGAPAGMDRGPRPAPVKPSSKPRPRTGPASGPRPDSKGGAKYGPKAGAKPGYKSAPKSGPKSGSKYAESRPEPVISPDVAPGPSHSPAPAQEATPNAEVKALPGSQPSKSKPAKSKPAKSKPGAKPKSKAKAAKHDGAAKPNWLDSSASGNDVPRRPRKPRAKLGAAVPGGAEGGERPKPPVGKPSSKKNRARQLAKAQEAAAAAKARKNRGPKP